jgi:6-phosphogluconolactonase
MEIFVAPTAAEAASLAATWMARRMRSAVRRRGRCRVAMSGGSTPALMFDMLAKLDVPWKSVELFQVDERVAPDGDPDRNSGQLVDHLVSKVTIPKRDLHLMPVTATSLARACGAYAAKLFTDPLDIVHLGIGDDGHTASWPPGDPVIDSTEPVAVTGVFNGRVRMTLTPPLVNAARARVVLVTGGSKANAVAGWLLHCQQLPIERVRRSGTTLIADEAAMQRVPSSALQ